MCLSIYKQKVHTQRQTRWEREVLVCGHGKCWHAMLHSSSQSMWYTTVEHDLCCLQPFFHNQTRLSYLPNLRGTTSSINLFEVPSHFWHTLIVNISIQFHPHPPSQSRNTHRRRTNQRPVMETGNKSIPTLSFSGSKSDQGFSWICIELLVLGRRQGM